MSTRIQDLFRDIKAGNLPNLNNYPCPIKFLDLLQFDEDGRDITTFCISEILSPTNEVEKVIKYTDFIGLLYLRVIAPYFDTTTIDPRGRNLLHFAAATGFANTPERVENILKKIRASAPTITIDTGESAGRTPLMIACALGQTAVVNALLASNATVELQDKKGTTALQYATATHSHKIVDRLTPLMTGRTENPATITPKKKKQPKAKVKAVAPQPAQHTAPTTEAPAVPEEPGPPPAAQVTIDADIRKSINTSDHTYQSVKVELVSRDNQTLDCLSGSTWNLMNRCRNLEDNGGKYANNPWNISETPEQYLQRKARQFEKILALLQSDDKDFMFLQEIDCLTTADVLPAGSNQTEYNRLKGAFIQQLKALGWDLATSPKGAGIKRVTTLYRCSTLKFVSQQPVLDGAAQECTFQHNGHIVTLTNLHLDYGKDYSTTIPAYQKQQVGKGRLTIMGGDTNRHPNKNAIPGLINNWHNVTNLGNTEANGSGIVTDVDSESGHKKCYDCFLASPTSDTAVRITEMPGEVFERGQNEGEFQVHPLVPQVKNNQNNAAGNIARHDIHLSEVGQPWVRVKARLHAQKTQNTSSSPVSAAPNGPPSHAVVPLVSEETQLIQDLRVLLLDWQGASSERSRLKYALVNKIIPILSSQADQSPATLFDLPVPFQTLGITSAQLALYNGKNNQHTTLKEILEFHRNPFKKRHTEFFKQPDSAQSLVAKHYPIKLRVLEFLDHVMERLSKSENKYTAINNLRTAIQQSAETTLKDIMKITTDDGQTLEVVLDLHRKTIKVGHAKANKDFFKTFADVMETEHITRTPKK